MFLAWMERRTYEPQERTISDGDWGYLFGVAWLLLRHWNLVEAVPRLQVMRRRMACNTVHEKLACEEVDRLLKALESGEVQ